MAKQSLEQRLLGESVRLLDLTEFCMVTEDTTVEETINRMRETGENCALVVGQRTRLVGILTDRDVLRKVAGQPDVLEKPVTEVMTANPQSLTQSATTGDALRMMEKGGFRNVPIVHENGAIVGNVTHFGVLRFLTDYFAQAVYNRPPDPENYADQRDGG